MIVGTFWVLLSLGHQCLEPDAAEVDGNLILKAADLHPAQIPE